MMKYRTVALHTQVAYALLDPSDKVKVTQPELPQTLAVTQAVDLHASAQLSRSTWYLTCS